MGLVGLELRATSPNPGSLLGVWAVEVTAAPVILVLSVLVLIVPLGGAGFSGVDGDTRPWMVLETRAETVTRSEEEGQFGLLALSEEAPELLAEDSGFIPFTDTPGGVFMEPLGVSTADTVTAGDVAAMGEEGLEASASKGLGVPDCTGGRGARYLTLADCDRGVDCVVGEDGFVAGIPDGIGGAGDLSDLGLEVKGFG